MTARREYHLKGNITVEKVVADDINRQVRLLVRQCFLSVISLYKETRRGHYFEIRLRK